MQAIENEILGLERKYWKAMKDNDIETAVALTRFPCLLTSPKGVQSITEDQYRKMMRENQSVQYDSVEVQDPKIDILNDDTAMIVYSIDWNGMPMLDVSTWIRQNGKWVCAYHSEIPKSESRGAVADH